MAEIKCLQCDHAPFKSERGLQLHMTLAHTRAGRRRSLQGAATRAKQAKHEARHQELLQAAGKLPSGNGPVNGLSQIREGRGITLLTKSTALWMIAETIESMNGRQVQGLMVYIDQLMGGKMLGDASRSLPPSAEEMNLAGALA